MSQKNSHLIGSLCERDMQEEWGVHVNSAVFWNVQKQLDNFHSKRCYLFNVGYYANPRRLKKGHEAPQFPRISYRDNPDTNLSKYSFKLVPKNKNTDVI